MTRSLVDCLGLRAYRNFKFTYHRLTRWIDGNFADWHWWDMPIYLESSFRHSTRVFSVILYFLPQFIPCCFNPSFHLSSFQSPNSVPALKLCPSCISPFFFILYDGAQLTPFVLPLDAELSLRSHGLRALPRFSKALRAVSGCSEPISLVHPGGRPRFL